MSKEIFTYSSNPFRMGGRQYDIIKTSVDEYERISLGKGYFGVLVKNPVKKLFHIAEETCGALIGTDSSKSNLIKRIRKDVKEGSEDVMEEQIKNAQVERDSALSLENKDFFERFKE